MFTSSVNTKVLNTPGFYCFGIHRHIADGYWRGAAVTKFSTKYFRIELCVVNGEGVSPSLADYGSGGASWAP